MQAMNVSDGLKNIRGERRGDIIAVARRLFTEKGHEATTMAELASELNVAEGTLYLYFENKRKLVAEVAMAWFEDIVNQIQRQAESIADPLARLQFLIQSHIEMIVGQPSMYLMYIREIRANPGYESSDGRALNRRYTDLLRSCLESAPPAGISFPVARDMVYGGVEHVAWSSIVHKDVTRERVHVLSVELANAYAKALGLRQSSSVHTELLRRLERVEVAVAAKKAGAAKPRSTRRG